MKTQSFSKRAAYKKARENRNMTSARKAAAARENGRKGGRPKRTTLVHDRFQACCRTCGFISGHLTAYDAMTAAQRHSCHDTEVWDAMSHNKAKDIIWRRPNPPETSSAPGK